MHNRQPVKQVLLTLFFLFSFSSYLFSITDALKLKIQSGSYSDETVIRFLPSATPGFDASYDAWKIFSSNPLVPAIYTQIDSVSNLSINALPSLVDEQHLTVFTYAGNTGSYTITATEIGIFSPSVSIILEDTETGNNIDLRQSNVYSFTVNDITAHNTNRNRFIIHFYEQTITSIFPTSTGGNIVLVSQPNAVNISSSSIIAQLNIYNLSGQLIYSEKGIFSTNYTWNISDNKSSVFLFEITTEREIKKVKQFIYK